MGPHSEVSCGSLNMLGCFGSSIVKTPATAGFGHERPRTHPSEEPDDFAHYGIVPLRSGMVA